jgi:hypothetical protein
MSGSRIKVAGRFKPCLHMGCFDLNTFVELNQRARKVSDEIQASVLLQINEDLKKNGVSVKCL